MSRFLTDPDCIAQREFVNIPAWHKAGYRGNGQTIFCDDVMKNSHYLLVKDVVSTILPEARVLTGNIGYRTKSSQILECNVSCFETGEVLPFDDFVSKYGVTSINNSTDQGNGAEVLPEAIYMKGKIAQYNLFFTGAAGNGYGQPTTQRYNGACVIVTSSKLENGKPVYGLKASGENLDFAMFYGFQSGTSFSSPFLHGMMGLIRSKFPNMTQNEIYAYLKSRCIAVGTKTTMGWGVPVLGDPSQLLTSPRINFKDVKWEKIEALRGVVPIISDGEYKEVVSILYLNENHIKLRDYKDVLGIADVEWDDVLKLPIVND